MKLKVSDRRMEVIKIRKLINETENRKNRKINETSQFFEVNKTDQLTATDREEKREDANYRYQE